MLQKVDHIVYCVPDMDDALAFFQEKLGVDPVIGGRHITKGTHNAILNLGTERYLEILAVDHANADVCPPRWMGIDLITSPTITRWCFKSDRLHQEARMLQDYDAFLGNVDEGIRQLPDGGNLKWTLSEPTAEPAIDIIPFLIDWSGSDAHPTDHLPVVLSLKDITLYHPNPEKVKPILNALSFHSTIEQRDVAGINITVQGPLGEAIL